MSALEDDDILVSTADQDVNRIVVSIDHSMGIRALEYALSPDARHCTSFFSAFRKGIRTELRERIRALGIGPASDPDAARSNPSKQKMVHGRPFVDGGNELDLAFCARYGVDDYSLTAINYLHRDAISLPSVGAYAARPSLSAGSFLLPTANVDLEIEVEAQVGVELAGVGSEISARKRKSYIALYGLRFTHEAFAARATELAERSCTEHQLDEARLRSVYYPELFICRSCALLATCTCFEGHFDAQDDILRLLAGVGGELREAISMLRKLPGICHLCTERTPIHSGYAYASSFLQRFSAYRELWRRRGVASHLADDARDREIENLLREQVGYPRIGERWVSEVHLLNIVRAIFSEHEVVHHYRGKELGGLELDIWVPALRLGVEYQGEQHFKPISAWGGAEGLRKTQERDARKRRLCHQLNYTLVEIKYTEELTPEKIEQRIRAASPKPE